MFRYCSHRFHWEGVSFQIPNGFFFDSQPGEESDNFMRLWSQDRVLSLWIYIIEECCDTDEGIRKVIEELSPVRSSPVERLSINGLNGHHATYVMHRSQYYEARLRVGNGSMLILIMESGRIRKMDISAVMAGIDPRCEMRSQTE